MTSALEGRLRDLGLSEVFQLLALGRKTGTLHVEAPLLGRRARIDFATGSVIGAEVFDAEPGLAGAARHGATDADSLEDAVLDVLMWRDGSFHFAPGDRTPVPSSVLPSVPSSVPSSVRLNVEPLLMSAARRAEVWARIEPRVPHARAADRSPP